MANEETPRGFLGVSEVLNMETLEVSILTAAGFLPGVLLRF